MKYEGIKLKKYSYNMWVYFILGIVVILNAVIFSDNLISRLGRGILLFILMYREFKILRSYNKIEFVSQSKLEKKEFDKRYRPYRVKVMAIWILFAVLCVAMEALMQVASDIYFSIAFIFFGLDLLFINKLCPLQVLSDPKKEVVVCCCGCPCRGWDILMINTPLFFAIKSDYLYEEILTVIAIIVGIITFIQWERGRYTLVVDKRVKCAKSCNLRQCIEYKN